MRRPSRIGLLYLGLFVLTFVLTIVFWYTWQALERSR